MTLACTLRADLPSCVRLREGATFAFSVRVLVSESRRIIRRIRLTGPSRKTAYTCCEEAARSGVALIVSLAALLVASAA